MKTLYMNRPKRRQVLECRGWRGTGLTPLGMGHARAKPKRCLPLLVIWLAAATLTPAWADENEVVKKDLAQMQGEWVMVSGSADGQPMPEPMLKQMKRVCKGDETTTTMAGRLYFKAKFALDPSKQPKTIDYQMTEGFTKGKTQLGIYKIEGDTFKACFGKPGAERPTDFSSKPGDGWTLSVWKRQKESPPQPERK